MSRIGPPPGLKKKLGFGCQCSMPCDIREHEPARTDPTLPPSTSSRASRPPAPRNVSGAQPSFSPRRFASCDQPMPVFRRDAERLFREYMLARGQRRMADLEMRVGRGQIDHHIDLGIAQQRVDRERANAELVGLDSRGLFQNIRTRHQPHAAKRREILHVDGRNDTAADDADAKILHRSLLQRQPATVA